MLPSQHQQSWDFGAMPNKVVQQQQQLKKKRKEKAWSHKTVCDIGKKKKNANWGAHLNWYINSMVRV